MGQHNQEMDDKVWKQYLQKFNVCLDERLEKEAPKLKTLINQKRTDQLWELWCVTLENAAVAFANVY